MSSEQDVVIVSACRTAIGSFMGALASYSPGKLGSLVIKETLRRADFPADQVDEVIMGNVLGAGWGQGVARQAAIWADVPAATPAFTVNKICGSGLKAVILAAQAVRLGDADVIVAGGTESMSTAPFVLKEARGGIRMGGSPLLDTMIVDGLTDVFSGVHMGITAENIAAAYGITRLEQDEFALHSQQKAEAAQGEGWFAGEIVPVSIPQMKGEALTFATDEYPRPGTTLEGLSRLKPAFKPDGTVTAGNASGINDGAAALLIMSRRRAASLGLRPLAAIRAYATAGVDPAYMGLGPVPATRCALQKAGLTVQDLDLVEANEAFAAQAIAVSRELGFKEETVNVNGGAIALGHPIGASGSRLVVTLLYEMSRRDLTLGLATLCIGGGMGAALVLERC